MSRAYSPVPPAVRIMLIVLLTFLTLVNAYALVSIITDILDDVDRGRGADAFVVVLALGQLVALCGLIAAWFGRIWGAVLFLGIQACMFVAIFITAPEDFTPILWGPIILGGLLWYLLARAQPRRGF